MLYLSLGIALMRRGTLLALLHAGAFSASESKILQEGQLLLGLFIDTPMRFLFYYKIAMGRNWARIALLILSILDITLAISGLIEVLHNSLFSNEHIAGMVFRTVAELILQVAALVILFQRTSSDWFRTMNSVQPLPLREEKKPSFETDLAGQADIANLVARIKGELIAGTGHWTLTNILVKEGWARKEASQFVRQIALELKINPHDHQLRD
jgi:hypothetical protein